jgi:hypothetical protein
MSSNAAIPIGRYICYQRVLSLHWNATCESGRKEARLILADTPFHCESANEINERGSLRAERCGSRNIME